MFNISQYLRLTSLKHRTTIRDINFKQLITKMCRAKAARQESGIFLVLTATLIFALLGMLTLGVDIFILLQSKMDLKIAANQAADGAIRYMTNPKLWHNTTDPSLSTTQTKMRKLTQDTYVIGGNRKYAIDTDFSFAPLEFGTYHADDGFVQTADPGTAAARKLVGDDTHHPAIKVTLATNNTNSRVSGLFTKIYSQTGYAVSATAVAYYQKNVFAGIGAYGVGK